MLHVFLYILSLKVSLTPTDDSISMVQFLSLQCICAIFKEVLNERLLLSLITKVRKIVLTNSLY